MEEAPQMKARGAMFLDDETAGRGQKALNKHVITGSAVENVKPTPTEKHVVAGRIDRRMSSDANTSKLGVDRGRLLTTHIGRATPSPARPKTRASRSPPDVRLLIGYL